MMVGTGQKSNVMPAYHMTMKQEGSGNRVLSHCSYWSGVHDDCWCCAG